MSTVKAVFVNVKKNIEYKHDVEIDLNTGLILNLPSCESDIDDMAVVMVEGFVFFPEESEDGDLYIHADDLSDLNTDISG